MSEAGPLLAIETSCDDTAVSLISADGRILSDLVSSQEEVHAAFGGIVPEVASRAHLELILPLIRRGLKEAGIAPEEVRAVAATVGPGLIGSLLVGLTAAKAFARLYGIPLVPVNHLEGHIMAATLDSSEPEYPYISLIASGGHTSLVLVSGPFQYRTVGRTLDDAAGEAFDKVARLLGLGYPGGPAIDRIANEGDENAFDFPIGLDRRGELDFSFSGLKSAVYYFWKENSHLATVADVAASFRLAVVKALLGKAFAAAEQYGATALTLSGGVAANGLLRRRFSAEAERLGLPLMLPPVNRCTDNAAMIAAAGLRRYDAGLTTGLDIEPAAMMPLG